MPTRTGNPVGAAGRHLKCAMPSDTAENSETAGISVDVEELFRQAPGRGAAVKLRTGAARLVTRPSAGLHAPRPSGSGR